MVNPIIELRNVSYQYPGMEQEVLKNISIYLEENQFITILGPNGSGKSTLAKLLNGLLLPTEGVVIVDQIDTNSDEEQVWTIRSQVGIVFQNPDNQIVANTVEDDVAFGLENKGIEPEVIRERVDKALDKVGLGFAKLYEPHYLSGGQKQKVAIAGIIAMKPKVIILDEATSMLDPKGKKEVLQTVKNLSSIEKITILHITHDLHEAILADRVIVLDKGKILLDGSPKKVFKERLLLKHIGLDVPLATELAYRLKENGVPIKEDIVSIEEFVQELWTYI
ncbi:energy-coupling factor transporter ATPase [Vulcanibacillus modesticaldus]|uniref:Energy-coupling factor transporter ATPase n=1 Tax=Vulcanibacillus modesticaldus TaxID=337097 RepID=A0A1D2YS66_9BACI|nr:energy-coupling factor transporter ATPase [Vulcanibacillus modesticaldus]OEF96447.1 energy-coupling factor transporter ATPase [Vulcanibacillus modesticaldus]